MFITLNKMIILNLRFFFYPFKLSEGGGCLCAGLRKVCTTLKDFSQDNFSRPQSKTDQAGNPLFTVKIMLS